ncbi:MAG: DegT/DnrJ/EryC1/StrS family aminotransferase, partial [Candidatus Marinimicrobia bacterium]|nr:DegT/DnrJ/EryC1/StrS family aminotransferase [Candidatus Neomarinimicrobiota bacterium]
MSELALFGGSPIRTKPFPSWPRSTAAIREQLISTLENEQWGVGSKTIDEFNNSFAEYHDANYCISVHSGTSALWVALKAADVKAGDEVIIPAYTFIATATAILMANAIPVFCDIDLKTGNIDPLDIESKITNKTKVIIPVHIAGSPADLSSILDLAKIHELVVIEDAAQAHGATYKGNKVGALGLGGIFSFQTSKNMSSGEGGAIITNNDEFADACFSYHNCGRVKNGKWYEHHRLGSNLRMSAFNAAMLIPQIDTLESETDLRDKNRATL